MKFKLTPFAVNINRNIISVVLKEDEENVYIKAENEKLVYPYFFQDNWYVFSASNNSDFIRFEIFVLKDKKFVFFDSFIIEIDSESKVINELYIPRLLFEEKEMEVKDKEIKKYDIITYDNEEESSPSYLPDKQEEPAFLEIADSLPSPMKNVKYADYIFYSVVNDFSRRNHFTTLNAVDISKMLEKKYEVKEIELEIEEKPLRQVIKHIDFSRNNSFNIHSVSSVFRPAEYSPMEKYLAIVNDSERSEEIINNLEKQFARINPTSRFNNTKKINNKTLIIFTTNPELFNVLCSRINKEDFAYLDEYV